jgi:hypothetical protein
MRQRACVLLALLSTSFILVCLSTTLMPMVANASTGPAVASQKSPEQDQTSKPRRDDDDPPLPRWSANLKLHAVGKNLGYGGGPVMAGTTRIYAIFWEPTGNVSARYNSLILRYFQDVGRSPLYHIAEQYKQSNGSFASNAVLAASWLDSRAYPASPVLDNDIQHEVEHAQRVNGWHTSIHALFMVFTEREQNICVDATKTQCTDNGYCAYHSATANNTIYAAIPYIASFHCDPYSGPNHDDADQAITGISHEQMESATDPFGNGWIDSEGNEVADKCEQNYGRPDARGADVIWNNDAYRLQEEWDNQTSSCRLTPSLRHASGVVH